VFDDVAGVTLASALQGLTMRQQVTANNIANIETPNYHAQHVDFESSLAAAVANGDPTSFSPSITATDDGENANGNNVRLDDETVIAMKDTLRSQLLSQALTNGFNLISTAIKG
jgi:flagellar basal-body rod protein FlgB